MQHLRDVQRTLPHRTVQVENNQPVDRGQQQRRRHGHEPLRQGQRRLSQRLDKQRPMKTPMLRVGDRGAGEWREVSWDGGL